MRRKWILIGITVILGSWLLVGCGVAQEQYDSLLSDINKAQEELQSVKAGLEADLNKAQEELQSVKVGLEADLSKAQDELQSAKADLEVDLSKAKEELENASKELSEIKKVYPLRDFSSLRELQEWLTKNDVSERALVTTAEAWYSKALEIQEDAMKDGYMISVDEDSDDEDNTSVFCVAIINGDIWYWDPETDEPMQDFSWGKVK